MAPEGSQIGTPGVTSLFQWDLFLTLETLGISQGSLEGEEHWNGYIF